MKPPLNAFSPWRLTVQTAGSAYADSVHKDMVTRTQRAGLASRVLLVRVHRTVTAEGTVGALVYLLQSSPGLMLHAQTGHIVSVTLEPVPKEDPS